jgi:hypothetical protein
MTFCGTEPAQLEVSVVDPGAHCESVRPPCVSATVRGRYNRRKFHSQWNLGVPGISGFPMGAVDMTRDWFEPYLLFTCVLSLGRNVKPAHIKIVERSRPSRAVRTI